MDEKKIIIVSNRIPYNIKIDNSEISYKKSIGGLVTALDPILLKEGGLWIGWSGSLSSKKILSDKIRIGEGFAAFAISVSFR